MFDLTPLDKRNNIIRGGDYYSQLFKNYFGDGFGSGFGSGETVNQDHFKVDVRETPNSYLLEVELADVKKEDIDVVYYNNYLTITAKREGVIVNKSDKYIRRERSFGELKRSFYADDIDDTKIEASYNDGMLRVVLPKQSKESGKRKIDIH